MKRRATCLWGGLAIVLASCTPSQNASKDKAQDLPEGGKVVDIVKADELMLQHGDDKTPLRMLGIHAFSAVLFDDKLAALGEKSQNYVRGQLLNKEITLTLGATPKDVHGRLLAYVNLDGKDQNLAMIQAGQAVVYTEFKFAREAAYLGAEAEARKAGSGLWSNPSAVKLVHSLRALWTQARVQRGQKAPNDPWSTQPLAAPEAVDGAPLAPQ